MIRRLIILLLIVGCGITKAQFINSYGLKLGIVNAKQDWSYSNPILTNVLPKSITNLFIGGYFIHQFSPKLYLRSGLEYMTKGAKSEILEVWGDTGGVPIDTFTSSLHLYYLSVPFQLKYIHKYQNNNFYGLMGFKYDILINKEGDWIGGDIFENLNNSEYCLTYGLGVMKEIKKYNVGLEISNSYPLSSVYSTDRLEIKKFTTDVSLLMQLHP